ncbi:hypothetical protein F5879DRAFT_997180, partial [Lentinula edodes]
FILVNLFWAITNSLFFLPSYSLFCFRLSVHHNLPLISWALSLLLFYPFTLHTQ